MTAIVPKFMNIHCRAKKQLSYIFVFDLAIINIKQLILSNSLILRKIYDITLWLCLLISTVILPIFIFSNLRP